MLRRPKISFWQYQHNVELANPIYSETGEYKFLDVDYRVMIGLKNWASEGQNPVSKRLQQQRLLKSTPKVPFWQYQRNVESADQVCNETEEYKFLAVDYRVVIGGLKAGLSQANVAGS